MKTYKDVYVFPLEECYGRVNDQNDNFVFQFLIDDEKTGILIAVKSQCFWIENEWQLQEVMLHSKNKITVGRLIKEYVRISREMIDSNEI
mgnify:CR=1 FL=1